MKKNYAVNSIKYVNGWNTTSYADYEKMVGMQKNIKKFIESFIFYECDMFKVRVYFSFHYNKNVLRATSEQKN